MTVPVQNPIVAYVGNGISTMFVFPFRVLSEGDLTVTINGAAPTIPYTLDRIGDDTGSVNFSTAPASGDKILLFRSVALTRSEDYQDNGDLLADTVNADFDRIWMALQSQNASIVRALKVPFSDISAPSDLPPAAARANKCLGFDNSGNPIAVDLTIGSVLSPVVHSIAMLRLVSKFFTTDVFVTDWGLGAGGGGPYVKAYDNAPTGWENGGTQIVAADGAAWQLKPVGPLTAQHFGAPLNDPTVDSYQACANGLAAAYALGVAWHWQGNIGLSQGLTVQGGTNITSDTEATITQVGSASVDYVIKFPRKPDGAGLQAYPAINGFSSAYAFQITGNLRRIVCPRVTNCKGAVEFAVGLYGSVLDSIAEIGQIGSCVDAVLFRFYAAGATCQGSGLLYNFITDTKNGVTFTGLAGNDDGLFFDGYAVDFTYGGGALLNNQIAGHSVPRFTARVRSWLGGNGFTAATNPTQLAVGSWNNADIDVVNAQAFTQANLAYRVLRGARVKTRQWGPIGSAAQMVQLSGGLPAFNGGKASDKTNFVAAITLAADLAAGATTGYYFYSIWADGLYTGWKINTITAPAGCSLVWAQDQGETEDYRVCVAVRNNGASAVAAGSVVNFYIERA